MGHKINSFEKLKILKVMINWNSWNIQSIKSANSFKKSSLSILLLTSDIVFLHSQQMHLLVQSTPIWKHSQYFFWHWLFLHLHPDMWEESINDCFVHFVWLPCWFFTFKLTFSAFWNWSIPFIELCSNSL
jgi:hypothetical protein